MLGEGIVWGVGRSTTVDATTCQVELWEVFTFLQFSNRAVYNYSSMYYYSLYVPIVTHSPPQGLELPSHSYVK